MIAEHVNKVFDMLLAGLTREKILDYVRSDKNKIGIEDADVPALMAEAEKRLQEFSRYEYQTELGRILKRYDDLYQRSYHINDFKACAQIERMRADVLAKNRPPEQKEPDEAPASTEPQPADRPGADPRLFDYAPLSTVARELNVSLRTLQRWIKGDSPVYQPLMPHAIRQGKALVKPIVAYEHIKTHAARSRDLRPPAGYIGPDQAARYLAEKAQAVAVETGASSPKDFLLSFLNGNRKATPAEINAFVNIVNSLVRAAEVEAKNTRRYDIKDLLQAAEDVRDLFISGMDNMTVRASLKLKNLLAEHFAVKLSAYANAQAILQNVLVDECEVAAAGFRDAVKEKLSELDAKDTR